MSMGELETIIRGLPPELYQQVKQFVLSLRAKQGGEQKGKLRMNWAGALREYRDRYTALELQKNVLTWWCLDGTHGWPE